LWFETSSIRTWLGRDRRVRPSWLAWHARCTPTDASAELTIPSSLTVGWWFDTPRYAPFFEARVEDSTQY